MNKSAHLNLVLERLVNLLESLLQRGLSCAQDDDLCILIASAELGEGGQQDIDSLLLLEPSDEGKERRRGVNGEAALGLELLLGSGLAGKHVGLVVLDSQQLVCGGRCYRGVN